MSDEEWDRLIDAGIVTNDPGLESTPQYVRRLEYQLKKANEALDFMHRVLSGTEWDSTTLDVIATVLEGTDRKIEPPS